MSTVAITTEQQGRLQGEVQHELEKREWAEPNDNVMAEYITVLIANGSTKDRVRTEMDDLVGSDFDPQFLDWLFNTASDIQRTAAPASPVVSSAQPAESGPSSSSAPPRSSGQPAPAGASRMFNGALADSQKRKAEGEDGPRKRMMDGALPTGPRMGGEGRSLADRLGGKSQNRGPMQVRGQGNGRGGMNGMGGFGNNAPRGFQGGFQQGMQPGMMGPGFGPGFFGPGQQEMMAQMMMMQANMAQMGEMMHRMAEEKAAASAAPAPAAAGARPPRPPPKIPHGTKLGAHSVSGLQPKTTASPGPIPTKPTSKALCRYSVGCSNSRCIYSHPSPVADEKTGMVLSDEPCEQGKDCKDAECIKSHVSPAAALGDGAGPSRLLCKYQNCSNPSCPFRHEDAEGNSIPPPALTAAKAAKSKPKASETVPPSSDNEDGDGDGDVEVVMTHKGLMDGALDDSKAERTCRYGDRCTRPNCKFSHPASRATPKARGSYNSPFNRPALTGNGFGTGGGGMNKSKKFGAAAAAENKKLDPAAGAFVPGAAADKDMDVTM